jgi:hypothetical protein
VTREHTHSAAGWAHVSGLGATAVDGVRGKVSPAVKEVDSAHSSQRAELSGAKKGAERACSLRVTLVMAAIESTGHDGISDAGVHQLL